MYFVSCCNTFVTEARQRFGVRARITPPNSLRRLYPSGPGLAIATAAPRAVGRGRNAVANGGGAGGGEADDPAPDGRGAQRPGGRGGGVARSVHQPRDVLARIQPPRARG